MAQTKKATKTTQKKTATKKTATTSTTVAKKAPKVFEPNTPIKCRSVSFGKIIYPSVFNVGLNYVFPSYNDVIEIPYQEIQSLKNSGSAFLYFPIFIIEDEDLMAQEEYAKEFGDMYEYYKDFSSTSEFFSQPVGVIRSKLQNAPEGLRDLIKQYAGDYIREGKLDSISVINTIDEVLGTNLKMYL